MVQFKAEGEKNSNIPNDIAYVLYVRTYMLENSDFDGT